MSYKGPIEIEMPLFSSKEWHEKDGHRCENLKKFTIATHDKGKKKSMLNLCQNQKQGSHQCK